VGTPCPDKWAGLSELPNWKPEEFEKFPAMALSTVCPRLDADGLDFLD